MYRNVITPKSGYSNIIKRFIIRKKGTRYKTLEVTSSENLKTIHIKIYKM